MAVNRYICIFLLFWLSPAKCGDDWEQTANEHVLDFAFNPILKPTELFEWLVADPTVVVVEKEVHMFANEVFHGILHFSADKSSPTNFTKQSTIIPFPGSVRPYVLMEDNTLYLFYEQYQLPLFRTSHIMLRKAEILLDAFGHAVFEWEVASTTILIPDLEWEKIGTQRVGNPFVFYSSPHSEYRMYYSASSIHLNGPWKRVVAEPIPVDVTGLLGDDVLGIGSLKFVKSQRTNSNTTNFVALCNRITMDPSDNTTGSTISLLTSTNDGLSWDASIGRLISPVTDDPSSWKHSYVYGYDSIPDPTDDAYFLVYYNGRDGWRQGVEAIGVSRVEVSVLNQ